MTKHSVVTLVHFQNVVLGALQNIPMLNDQYSVINLMNLRNRVMCWGKHNKILVNGENLELNIR